MSGYGVILADCPWAYRNASSEGAAALQYQTMPVADLCALDVASLAAPDAVLLLWATWPLLTDAIAVMHAWGFAYKAGFPWIKVVDGPQQDLWGELRMRPHYGIGWWVRGCSEPLLIGVRGNAKPPGGGMVGLLSPNFQHSRKPDSIYEYAEQFPGPWLELFARRPRPGWDSIGNWH